MIWVDAHLSPAIAIWIADTFKIPALALRDVGLRDAEDPEICEAAKAQGIIFITKDSDFVDMGDRTQVLVTFLEPGKIDPNKLRQLINQMETITEIQQEIPSSESW
jgi:predicted nuclease of predicted toxin-antitoxin system